MNGYLCYFFCLGVPHFSGVLKFHVISCCQYHREDYVPFKIFVKNSITAFNLGYLLLKDLSTFENK